MSDIKPNTVRVPGASLYYKMRGSGPFLFMIAGGSGDADSYDSVAAYLERNQTIVTYDRRGYSRSPLQDGTETSAIEIETQSDDANRLLAALTHEPAYIFGSSLGALIGLDLAIRHPEQVRMLVAHEPPLAQLLPAGREAGHGLEPRNGENPLETVERFAASIGILRNPMNEETIQKAWDGKKEANAKFFLVREAKAVGHYRIEFDKLKGASTKVVLAGGEAGREYFPYQCAQKAAEILGTTLIEFPGHHAGFAQHPKQFAEKLQEILSK